MQEKFDQQKAALENKIAKLSDKLQQLELGLATAKQTKESLEGLNLNLQQQALSHKEEIENLTKQLQAKNAELGEQKQQSDKTVQQFKIEQANQLKQLQQQKQQFETKKVELENQLKEQVKNLSAISEKNALIKMQQDIEKVGQQDEKIEQLEQKLQKEKELFAKEKQRLEEEFQKQRDEEKKKQQEATGSVILDKGKAEFELKQVRENLVQKQKDFEEQKKQIQALQQGLPPKIKDMQKLIDQQRTSLESRIEGLAARLPELEAGLARAKQEKTNLEKANIDLQTKLQESEGKRRAMEQRLQTATKETKKEVKKEKEFAHPTTAPTKKEVFPIFGPEAVTGIKLPEFHELVGSGKLEKIGEFLSKKGKEDLKLRDQEGRTPLFIAVQIGKRDIVDFLIQQGADVNALDNSAHSVLQYVGDNIRQSVNILKTLKQRMTAEKKAAGLIGLAQNYSGMEQALLNLARLLIEKGANPNYFNEGNFIYDLIVEVHPESAEEFKRALKK